MQYKKYNLTSYNTETDTIKTDSITDDELIMDYVDEQGNYHNLFQ